jgi:uncharacterized protein
MQQRVVITGGSGFLGSEITALLIARGVSVVSLDIVPPKNSAIAFVQGNIGMSIPKDPLLEHPTAVINLAGVPIFGRWTPARMQAIYDSRVVGTRNLVATFAEEKYRPQRFVSASATGFYGDRGDEMLDAASRSGDGFLASVSRDWETEARRATLHGVHTTVIRNGHILGHGGLLSVLLPWYKRGLGGPIGRGAQYMPWIHIRDCAELYVRAALGEIEDVLLVAAAPEQVTNKTMSQQIARTIHRPHLFYIPIWALRLLYGDLGREMVTSQRVTPALGTYSVVYPKLSDALANLL